MAKKGERCKTLWKDIYKSFKNKNDFIQERCQYRRAD